MPFSLDSLRCFEAAATCLNFSVAASRVALSPTAFSERIKRLEDDLGHRLFERSTRRVLLTQRGLQLLPHARQLLLDAQRCEKLLRETPETTPFALTVGTRFELGMSWLVPELAQLRKLTPQRKIHVAFSDGPELLNQVRSGRIDAMISSIRLTSAGLSYASLHEEHYCFVASPKLIRHKPFAQPADATAHTLLDTQTDLPLFRYFVDAYAGEQQWRFSDLEYLGTIAAVRHRALQGAGVAVLPRYFVASDLKSGRLQILLPKIKLTRDFFRLVWRADHPRQDELQALAEQLKRVPLR